MPGAYCKLLRPWQFGPQWSVNPWNFEASSTDLQTRNELIPMILGPTWKSFSPKDYLLNPYWIWMSKISFVGGLLLSWVWLFCEPHGLYIAHQISMGFPRWEYWSGLLFPSPRDLSERGIEPALPALEGTFFTNELPGKPKNFFFFFLFFNL